MRTGTYFCFLSSQPYIPVKFPLLLYIRTFSSLLPPCTSSSGSWVSVTKKPVSLRCTDKRRIHGKYIFNRNDFFADGSVGNRFFHLGKCHALFQCEIPGPGSEEALPWHHHSLIFLRYHCKVYGYKCPCCR